MATSAAKVLSVNVGTVREFEYGECLRTAGQFAPK